jgi:hypothetical protein
VEKIVVDTISFSGGDMASWELEPQTGGTNIYWPNPYLFSEDHLLCYRQTNPASLAKMYISYALYAYADACHEGA